MARPQNFYEVTLEPLRRDPCQPVSERNDRLRCEACEVLDVRTARLNAPVLALPVEPGAMMVLVLRNEARK